MANSYVDGKYSPLKNVSLYAIFKELGRRELKSEGVKIEVMKDQYIIKINRKEVDI